MLSFRVYGFADAIRGVTGTDKKYINYYDVLDNCIIGNSIVNEKLEDSFFTDDNTNITRANVRKGDIIFPIKRQDHSCKYINWDNENIVSNYVYNSEIICIRTINNNVNSKFLFFIFNTKEIQDIINSQAIKLKPNRITNDIIGNLEINLPDIEEQNKIVAELEDIARKKAEIDNKLKEYVNISK